MKVTDLPRGTEVKPQSDRKQRFLSLVRSLDCSLQQHSVHTRTLNLRFLFVSDSRILRVALSRIRPIGFPRRSIITGDSIILPKCSWVLR